jgi:hypothetical protein
MAYTSVAAVSQVVGQTLEGFASQRANQLLSVADAFIDSRTGHPWNTTVAVTDELHVPAGEYVYLTRRPVASVTSVRVRSPYLGSTLTTLTAATQYELVDAPNGRLYVPGYSGWLLYATYVPNVPNHPLIGEAAAQLVAHWLRPTLDGVSGEVKSYSVGQELSVTFRDPGTGTVLGVPSEIVALIDQAAGGAVSLAFA